MKYFSETMNKVYDTVEELEAAEKALAEKLAKEEQAKAEAKAKREQEIAEAKAKKEALAKERGERAKEVENAIKELTELRKECAEKIDAKQKIVNELVNKFIADFGSFHFTYRSGEDMPAISVAKYMKPFASMFDDFFKNF